MVFRRNKNKIKVIFFREVGENNFEKIGETKIDLTEDSVSYKNKTFPITDKCYIYIEKNEPKIFIDYENNKIITFHTHNIGIDSKFLDKFLTTSKRGIIGQLMQTLKTEMTGTSDWKKWMSPMAIFILGAVIGYLLGSPNPFGMSG